MLGSTEANTVAEISLGEFKEDVFKTYPVISSIVPYTYRCVYITIWFYDEIHVIIFLIPKR